MLTPSSAVVSLLCWVAALKEGLGLGKDNYESLTQQQQDELAERFYRYSNNRKHSTE